MATRILIAALLTSTTLANAASDVSEYRRDEIRDRAIHNTLGYAHETRFEPETQIIRNSQGNRPIQIDSAIPAGSVELPNVQVFYKPGITLESVLNVMAHSIGFSSAFHTQADKTIVLSQYPEGAAPLELMLEWLSREVGRDITVAAESRLIMVMPDRKH